MWTSWESLKPVHAVSASQAAFWAQGCSKYVGTLEHTSPPSFADPSKWQSTCLSKGRSRDAPKSHQNFCNRRGGWLWTFNLAPKAKAKMAFQIFSNPEWVETLGKRTAVKLKDLEAGCISEGVTSKANNHQKQTSKYKK